MINDICTTPKANVTVNIERVNPEIRNKPVCLLSPLLFNILLDVLPRSVSKEMKAIFM